MEMSDAVAPSYLKLRPMRPPTAGFPIYQRLADTLVKAETHPDDIVRHVLATCAGYAYSDADTVSMMMARMGLAENHCVRISEVVDAMFICSTSFLVQSADGRVVILCFRGTEPLNVINWLTDADIYPDRISIPFRESPGSFDVHAGFYRNVRATRFVTISALERALNGKSVRENDATVMQPMEALYITGHSLGGAMAAIIAIMLKTEKQYAHLADKLKSVYTFGQPMVGSGALALACGEDDFLGSSVFRYIYNHDIVPQLPPRVSGGFTHFGREYRYNGKEPDGKWLESSRVIGQAALWKVAIAPAAFGAHQFRWFRRLIFRASLDDHGPGHYIAAVTPPEKNEFGD